MSRSRKIRSVDLRFDAATARIKGKLEATVLDRLSVAMRYRPKESVFQMSATGRGWDGYFYLFAMKEQEFPTGLVREAVLILKRAGYSVRLIDERRKPGKRKALQWIGAKEPRDYQLAGVETAIEATRGVWNVATGGGKMLMAALLTQRLGLRSTILCWTEEAVLDTLEEFRLNLSGCSIEPFYGGQKSIGYVTIMTIQSLLRATATDPVMKHFLASDLLIIDEVHHSGASETTALLARSKAFYRIGQTATAFRGDRKDIFIQANTGRLLTVERIPDLQRRGILAECEAIFIDSPPPVDVALVNKYVPAKRYLAGIVNNDGRNEVIAKLFRKHKSDTVLCVVTLIEHGELLAEMTGATFVSGPMSKKERAAVREGIRSGSITKIVATKLYDESVNFPRLNVGINAAGYSAPNAQVQRVGRILRTMAGKDGGSIFYDFFDGWNGSARQHSQRRMAILKKEGINVRRQHEGKKAVRGLLALLHEANGH